MGNDRSKDVVRALGILFPRDRSRDPRDRLLPSGALGADITYTQAEPRAGLPEPTEANSGTLELCATGWLDEALRADLEVRICDSGLPGTSNSARALWRYDEEGDEVWYGWDVPTLLGDWESIAWTDGTASYAVRETGVLHALGLPGGRALVLLRTRKVIAGTTTYNLVLKIRSRGGTWTSVTIYSTETAPDQDIQGCLWYVPDTDDFGDGLNGRTYCAMTIQHPTKERVNVRIWGSDDHGDTWTQLQRRALDTEISYAGSPGPAAAGYDIGRIRGAAHNGQACLVVSLKSHDTDAVARDIFMQFAARDSGTKFTLVETWDKSATPAEGGAYHELLVIRHRFALIYLPHGDAEGRPVMRMVGSAYEGFLNDGLTYIDVESAGELWGTVVGNDMQDGDLAAAIDWDGTIYVYGRESTANSDGVCFRSVDGGQSFEPIGQTGSGIGRWWYGNSSTTCPINIAVAAQGGRMVVAHNWLASVGDEGDSAGAFLLGSWTNVTMADLDGFPADTNRVGWERTWLPFDLPDDADASWTSTTSGTESATLDDGHMRVVTTSGQHYWTRVLSTTPTLGAVVLIGLRVNSGGSITSDAVGLRLQIADATDGVDISLRFNTAFGLVRDNNAGVTRGSRVADLDGAFYQVLMAVGGGKVSAWMRQVDGAATRTWLAICEGETAAGATVATDEVWWGVGISGAVTASADFTIQCATANTLAGLTAAQLAAGPPDVDTLFGGPLAAMPYPYEGGVQVFGLGGPGFSGDTWSVPITAEWSLDVVLPEVEPSPRVGWRSVADSAEETIGIQVGGAGAQRAARDGLVCALFAVEQRLHYLEGYDSGAGTWTTLATLDAAQGQSSLPFTRTGESIGPDTTASGVQTPFLHAATLLGGHARLGSGLVRPIIGQSSGLWQTTNKTGRYTLPVVTLSGVEPTDPATGTAQLWSSQVCALVHLGGAAYDAYRIRIPSQDSANGYFAIGTWFLGYLHPLAVQYGQGRQITYNDGTIRERLEDGRTVVYEAGPTWRSFQLTWEKVDTSFTWAEPDPDYINGYDDDAPAMGTPQAAPLDVEGIWRELAGAHDPILYLPYVPTTAEVTVLTSPHDFALVRISEAPQVTNIVGDEHDDEVLQVSVGLEEIV